LDFDILGTVNSNARSGGRVSDGGDFDLVRLSHSKEAVDLAPNTIRALHRQGLPVYRMGKAAFFSKLELREFIRARGIVERRLTDNPPNTYTHECDKPK
jgi:hypothetical protein